MRFMGSFATTVTSGLRDFTSRQRSRDDDEIIYISRSFQKKRIPYIYVILITINIATKYYRSLQVIFIKYRQYYNMITFIK